MRVQTVGQAISAGGASYQVLRGIFRSLVLLVEPTTLEAGVIKPLVPDIESLLNRPIADAPEIGFEANQLRLFSVMTDLLRRSGQPLVVMLEDMHWLGLR